ncbi:DUF1828 domain-containing protein [Tepidimicrobium xylanilyticum]|uniref:DUF1828 domain-containing protein n=1 Tax=Tepidimicrobium xylanilyticum TaxID=1123352 RepID=A0A1H3EAZ5_9FIRM|nr:DUF1828 domain-containing protein [Tepidimicrobium xylanilyticum]SDX75084.1 protein of unknown function DUF1828 [Tepidimicrobium xylanilyticum]
MITSFKDDFVALLNRRTIEYQVADNITRITTPLLDRNNDAIEVYIIKNGKQIKITDDGYIINDLDMSGLTIEKDTLRYKYLQNILANHGVELGENNELMVNADISNYSLKMYLLVQCMSKISDLYVLNKPSIKSLFNEDVKNYLITNDIRFIENPFFIGKSKLTTQFDFAIPRFKDAPERIIKVTSNITLNFARTTIFGWEDIKENRGKDSVLYVIIDDRNRSPSEEITIALNSYGIKPVEWTKIDDFKPELTA